jgi:hypothetical protein
MLLSAIYWLIYWMFWECLGAKSWGENLDQDSGNKARTMKIARWRVSWVVMFSSIIRGIISRMMVWVGRVACMVEMRNAHKIWVGKSDGWDPLGELGIDEKGILKWCMATHWLENWWIPVRILAAAGGSFPHSVRPTSHRRVFSRE